MNQHAEPFLKDTQALDDFTQSRVSRPHESAHLHVSGRATHTDDIPTVAGTLHAALGLSSKAHAKIVSVSLDKVRATPGVVAIFTADRHSRRQRCRADRPRRRSDSRRMASFSTSVSRCSSWSRRRTKSRSSPRAAREIVYEELPAILTAQRGARRQSVRVAADEISRAAEAGHEDRTRRRIVRLAKCCSAARSSFIWKGRSPTRCRRTTTACTSTVQRASDGRNAASRRAARWALRRHNVLIECRPHGRRFRRQGIAVGSFSRTARRSPLRKAVVPASSFARIATTT